MENFIREGKSGFDFASVSSSLKLVNANRLLVHTSAYNLFNWFRRLALAVSMRKQRINTIRVKLMKIAARVIKSARFKYFKLNSSALSPFGLFPLRLFHTASRKNRDFCILVTYKNHDFCVFVIL